MKIGNQLGAVLFWSVISAAFIGPGTVTTASSAGTAYGIDLIWVLVLSMIACIVLQVNVTRLTITNKKTIGELLLMHFKGLRFIPLALGMSIVFGCMAYQTGNLLGAALGLSLVMEVNQKWAIILIVLLSSGLLWFGSMKIVVKSLGIIVALMGVVFMGIALSVDYPFSDIIKSSFIPKFPSGSEILVIGLIGTTVVPYNLFLGSGLSKDQSISTATMGLILAIGIGGIISIAILLVGTLVNDPFDFWKLSETLTMKSGEWANLLLAIGLFSAGFTSSMTAPIAAVFTIQSIFPNVKGFQSRNSKQYRFIWILVMGSGLFFGLLDKKPIPAIILAQAANGIILPFIASFILYIHASGSGSMKFRIGFNTILLLVIVSLIVMIGVFNLWKLLPDPRGSAFIFSFVIGILVAGITLVLSLLRKFKSR